MSAAQQILEALNEAGGNVAVVADRLCIDPSYVNRVKLANSWRMPVTDERALAVRPEQALANLLPPNHSSLVELRDLTIEALKQKVLDEACLTSAEQIRLLKLLLNYETTLRAISTPIANVFNDNRSINVTSDLVDRLAVMQPKALRALSGVPEPIDIIVEGETRDVTDN